MEMKVNCALAENYTKLNVTVPQHKMVKGYYEDLLTFSKTYFLLSITMFLFYSRLQGIDYTLL